MLLLASDSEGLQDRWSAALGASGVILERVAPSQVAARLSAEQVAVCLFDLGEQAQANQRLLQALVQRFPDTRFIALAALPSVQQGIELLRVGVRGYCNRLAGAELLPIIVRTVQADELWVGAQVAQHLLAGAVPEDPPPEAGRLASLTPREREIARMVGEGLSNKAIAARSGITERTVKAHLNAIFRKTGIRNRVRLALEAAPPGRRMARA